MPGGLKITFEKKIGVTHVGSLSVKLYIVEPFPSSRVGELHRVLPVGILREQSSLSRRCAFTVFASYGIAVLVMLSLLHWKDTSTLNFNNFSSSSAPF
jgi:hypothetical protein